ncbi:MAG: recombination-associated protein RdgC [Candidatus Saccharibacteria bacterium]|nr:recombination-associated protein RdgC [Rhodoferax sp.]
MFKNLMMYRLASPWPGSVEQVEAALEDARFVECGASQEKSVGWIEPRGHANGALLEVVNGQWLLKLMLEVKVVPGSVVKRKVQEQLDHIEATTGRKPGKKEKREISEDARLALLPLAFTKQSSVKVWVDPKAGMLLTDAGSQSKADEVLTWLIKAVAGLAVTLVNTQTSPAAAMSLWLSTKEAPPGFSVDRECELKAADESKAVVRYMRHALDTEEVSQHIAMGKVPTRLAMTWDDRVSFVLTEGLQLKKLGFLETVFDGAAASPGDVKEDNFDADVAIATGELSKLIPELLQALGGEAALA